MIGPPAARTNMLVFAIIATFAVQPAAAPVPFDTLTVEDARRMHGQEVVVTFKVGAPAYTWGEGAKLVTVVGPGEVDEHERAVTLRGDRLRQMDMGRKVTASGRMQVIDHPAAVVAGIDVPAWTELRVEE